jgi:hypothetical protein
MFENDNLESTSKRIDFKMKNKKIWNNNYKNKSVIQKMKE